MVSYRVQLVHKQYVDSVFLQQNFLFERFVIALPPPVATTCSLSAMSTKPYFRICLLLFTSGIFNVPHRPANWQKRGGGGVRKWRIGERILDPDPLSLIAHNPIPSRALWCPLARMIAAAEAQPLSTNCRLQTLSALCAPIATPLTQWQENWTRQLVSAFWRVGWQVGKRSTSPSPQPRNNTTQLLSLAASEALTIPGVGSRTGGGRRKSLKG